MSDPTPGGESYPLEVPGEDTPLGADPPAPWPPCPDCGAPRRLPEPVCLQCGLDERTRGEAVAAGAAAAAADAAAAGHSSPGAGDAEEDPAPAGVRASDANRDPDLAPLLRSWPGGERLVWIAAFVVLGLLLAGAVSGTSGFPPGELTEDQPLSAWEHGRSTLRMLVAAGLWSIAAWGVCLGLAWGQDRPVGGRAALGGRMLLVASASRLAMLLPVSGAAVAFLVEGFVALVILAGGTWMSLRVPAALAAGIAGVTALVIGSVALVAQLLTWALA
jgi:hypothetical protein